MLRKSNILICLAAVTLCSAGIALGKAVKHELVSEDEQVLGKAKLNYAKGADKTECQVNCWDLDPEEEYIVTLCDFGENGEVLDQYVLGSFTTNEKGIGHLHASVAGDLSDWPVAVGVNNGDGTWTPMGLGSVDQYYFLFPVWPEDPIFYLPGPKVVQVEPAGDISSDNDIIRVTFDRPIDPSTVTANTFRVYRTHNWDERPIGGTLSVTDNGLTVAFVKDDGWADLNYVDIELVGTPDPDASSEVMKSTMNVAIDGDADGYPGGNFIWGFYIFHD